MDRFKKNYKKRMALADMHRFISSSIITCVYVRRLKNMGAGLSLCSKHHPSPQGIPKQISRGIPLFFLGDSW